MMKDMNRPRRVAILTGLAGALALAGCDRVKQELLAPQNPDLLGSSVVGTPVAALNLRNGALARFNQVVNAGGGEATWAQGGLITDEFKNADFQVPRQDFDRRTMAAGSDGASYPQITQARGYIRSAIDAMQKFNPDSTSMIAELYAELGFFEMTLADNYCNGIPLGHLENGKPVNGAPLTIQQVYDSASAHLDTALLINTKSDAQSVFVRRMTQVFKARVLVGKGSYSAAAAFVTAANVPTSFQYDMTFSSAGAGTNGLWSVANSVARITVGDSFDIVNGSKNVIGNALPFASANDPRLPIVSGTVANVNAEDVSTPMFLSQLWKGQFDPLVLASGVDARLIEAEAALNANGGTAGDIANMMTILNALRASQPSIGLYAVPAMGALPTPANTAAAVKLLFREKAFWTFGRGQRLPDLRRLIRQYGGTFTPGAAPTAAVENGSTVFPIGVYFKGGVYGSDVNLQVPTSEHNGNPNFTACLDRNA
jgi:starch-binding outer membrane protein, SusD/RagB family